MPYWLLTLPTVLAPMLVLRAVLWRDSGIRSGWDTVLKRRGASTPQGETGDEIEIRLLTTGMLAADGVRNEVLFLSTEKLLAAARDNELLASSGEHEGDASADLLEMAENEDSVTSVIHVYEGFDALFRTLGPPPEGGRAALEVTGSGDGGMVQ